MSRFSFSLLAAIASIVSQLSRPIGLPLQVCALDILGVSVVSNLANVPIFLLVGQWDGDENPEREASRKVMTRQTAMELRRLQSDDHGYYIYDTFLHPTNFPPQR